MERKHKAAIVGCGRMAGLVTLSPQEYPSIILPYRHAPAYAAIPNMELVAAADIERERLAEFCARWNIPKRYCDFREMIETEKPDLLSVTTHAVLHAEATLFAAEHGVKAIYCEKAMACSLQEADAMVETVERNRVAFNIGTLRRFHPGYEKMRDVAGGGELGSVRTAVFFGSGELLHTASHSIDTLCYLLGDPEPESVWGQLAIPPEALSGNRLDSDPVLRSFHIRFAGGLEAYGVPAPGLYEFEVHCTGGMVRSMNNGVHWMLRKPLSPAAAKVRGGAFWESAQFPEFERRSPTVRCIEDLIACIETGRATRGDVRVARKVMEISMGLVESHRIGGAAVRLPVQNRGVYIGSR